MPNQLQQLKETASYEAVWSWGQVLTGTPKAFKDINKATVAELLVDKAFDLAMRELFREEIRKAIGTFL
jgi:hypothetical protein